MKPMSRTYKKEDALLRPHKESTLEKQEVARNKPKPQELEVDSKYDTLDKLNNQRMKRKAMLHAAMNKIHDADIA